MTLVDCRVWGGGGGAALEGGITRSMARLADHDEWEDGLPKRPPLSGPLGLGNDRQKREGDSCKVPHLH